MSEEFRDCPFCFKFHDPGYFKICRMEMRDKFAAAALQGLIASTNGGQPTFEAYAKCAYHHADAMIAERGRE